MTLISIIIFKRHKIYYNKYNQINTEKIKTEIVHSVY